MSRDYFPNLAERGGFEPPIRLPAYTISSRAPSTSSAISPDITIISQAVYFAERV